MNNNIKAELKKIVTPDRFRDDPETLASYSYDGFNVRATPEIVLFPVTTDEISQTMKIANHEKIPVTVRGAGTNLSGGSVPHQKGIVLCLTKMNKILEIKTRDRYAIVQPGVVNGDLQQALAKDNFFFPPDPSSFTVSTIGGNIAENAGGPRCLKYGVTVDYVMGLEVVLASGKIIRLGSRNVKDVTGYRPSGIFCGSEGTLGIITEATVRVAPIPETKQTAMITFADLDHSAQTVADVIGSGILPAAAELMDNAVINVVEDAMQLGLPRDAEGIILVDVDGVEEAVEKELNKIVEIARANHATDIQIARTKEESDALWTARRAVYGIQNRLSPDIIVEDATVPVSRIPEMIRGCKKIAARHDIKFCIVGHAGDGNLHPTISTDIRNKEEMKRVEAACIEIFKLAHELGGCLTGEHGVGLAKAPYLSLVMSPDTMEFLSTIKASLDPNNILNPGKFA